jgi:hypothetical protein
MWRFCECRQVGRIESEEAGLSAPEQYWYRQDVSVDTGGGER